MDELATAYNPSQIEAGLYDRWEKDGLFGAEAKPGRRPYTIVIPPPNVTGSLHMGHAFEHTLQDAYIRRARMQGYEALWVPGTDHAGIATQNVVERELAKEGTNRHDLGREAFVERVWQWKAQYGGRITEQMRRLGNSCDWERERFTMDEGLSRAVRTVFVRWFDEGLIYRGLRIINWCPRCETALSDIEVEHEDVAGEIITFRYELAGGEGSISVATTRVETMLGDTGVAVHPDDDRYKDLVGKDLRHPFFPERRLPVVADAAVDPEFGTGAVKVTPAHDPTDFEIGERAGLEKVNIFDRRAHTEPLTGRFAGLDRYAARAAVLAALEELGVVESVERPYVHPVGHCYRCHTEVEPWLSEQWFVKMKPLAEPAIEAVRDGRIEITPTRFVKSYMEWMTNIRDWCISRQIWWGHRIPVWYCDGCEATFASEVDPTECKTCSSSDIRQDEDVLDTWFSSQLWPFSTLGWPDKTDDLSFFYPTTLMAPGYEILYLWVARMIMSGMYFMGDVPFTKVMIHGIVRDFEGKKMSKSSGNVIDPLEIIERYGADALRFSLASAAVPGNDTNISEDRVEGARNFANKLWNATRFVLMSLGDERPPTPDPSTLAPEDRWILSRLDQTITAVEGHLDSYNVAEAMRTLYGFTWSEYCDWYIELAKRHLDGERAEITKSVLVEVLGAIVRLLHPVMPFITEELWTRLRPDDGSVMVTSWPEPSGRVDEDAESLLGVFQEVVGAVRRMKVDYDIPQSQPIAIAVAGYPALAELEAPLLSLARVDTVAFVTEVSASKKNAIAITPSGVEVSAIDIIDPAKERSRLEKAMSALDSEIERLEKKLRNAQFVERAPAAIVEKERSKLAELRTNREKLEAQLSALA